MKCRKCCKTTKPEPHAAKCRHHQPVSVKRDLISGVGAEYQGGGYNLPDFGETMALLTALSIRANRRQR